MDYLSFIPCGIPTSSRLVYRPVYPQSVVPAQTAETTGAGGGTARFFTPYHALPGRKLRRRIDEIVAEETALKERIEAYQQGQHDPDTLQELYDALKELQLRILQLALESEAAAFYIETKRNAEEDAEVQEILRILDLL